MGHFHDDNNKVPLPSERKIGVAPPFRGGREDRVKTRQVVWMRQGSARPTAANLHLQRALSKLVATRDRKRAAHVDEPSAARGKASKRRKRQLSEGLRIEKPRRVIDEFFDVLTWSVVCDSSSVQAKPVQWLVFLEGEEEGGKAQTTNPKRVLFDPKVSNLNVVVWQQSGKAHAARRERALTICAIDANNCIVCEARTEVTAPLPPPQPAPRLGAPDKQAHAARTATTRPLPPATAAPAFHDARTATDPAVANAAPAALPCNMPQSVEQPLPVVKQERNRSLPPPPPAPPSLIKQELVETHPSVPSHSRLEDQWRTTGSKWVGARAQGYWTRFVDNKTFRVSGTVISWLEGSRTCAGAALWRVLWDDNEGEDLEEHEVAAAVASYQLEQAALAAQQRAPIFSHVLLAGENVNFQ